MVYESKGAVLVTCLIILMMMTIIGVSLIRSTAVEEKMAGNSTDVASAFQAAESALRSGEGWIADQTEEPTVYTTCSSQPCIISKQNSWFPADETSSWWSSDANSSAYTSSSLSGIKTQPRFIIEFDRFIPDNVGVNGGLPTGMLYYRVTARGTGGTDTAVSILQSTYARRY